MSISQVNNISPNSGSSASSKAIKNESTGSFNQALDAATTMAAIDVKPEESGLSQSQKDNYFPHEAGSFLDYLQKNMGVFIMKEWTTPEQIKDLQVKLEDNLQKSSLPLDMKSLDSIIKSAGIKNIGYDTPKYVGYKIGANGSVEQYFKEIPKTTLNNLLQWLKENSSK